MLRQHSPRYAQHRAVIKSREACNISGYDQWRIQREGWCDRPPLWSVSEVLDNLCTVFVSFVSRLNRNIRVPKLRVTVRVICLLKLRQNTPEHHFGDKNDFFPPSYYTPLPRRQRHLVPSY